MAIDPFNEDVFDELRVLEHQSCLTSGISVEEDEQEEQEEEEEVFQPEQSEMTEEEQSLVEKVITFAGLQKLIIFIKP